MANFVAVGDAVEVEKHRIQLRAQDQAALLSPGEGRPDAAIFVDISQVAGERRHVMGRVGQFQHRLAHDFAG